MEESVPPTVQHLILDGPDSHQAYGPDARLGESVRRYRERKQREREEQQSMEKAPTTELLREENAHILREVKKAQDTDKQFRKGAPNLPWDQRPLLPWRNVPSLVGRLLRRVLTGRPPKR